MHLLLAAMPWQALYRPSLPIGLLHSLIAGHRPAVKVTEYHGSLRWVDHVGAEVGYDRLIEEYRNIAETGIFQGLGEQIFSGALYDVPGRRADRLRQVAEANGFDVELVMSMQRLAAGFIAAAAEEIIATEPDLVGFTSTFMQNVPSLALARRLKQLHPDLRIVIGGANCEGPMGHALHRNHPFVDFVIRGEAEHTLPQLLDRVATDAPVDDVPGLCWWNDHTGVPVSVANPVSAHGVPPADIPMPDYDQWFRTFESSPVHGYLRPELVVEGSRGCWWGEKHHCTFCGLNGSLMAFRSKSAEQLWAEIQTLVHRHQILDFITSDNILDLAYFKTLLPLIAAAGWDLRVHFEIKSNLRPEQVAALPDAGLVSVQAGVESLNRRVLDLMDKGVDGTANVQLLREGENHHLTVFWNYLYGFPGERDEDYRTVIDQLPALVHLQPPVSSARILMERFNPYFERPSLGFSRRAPAAFYRDLYDLPDPELVDLAYYFDCDQAGIDDELAAVLDRCLADWRAAYPTSTLTVTDDGDVATVDDRRRGWPHRRHQLSGWRAEAYRLLARPRTVNGLCARLLDSGQVVDHQAVESWLWQVRQDGLVFTDGDRSVAIATRSVAVKVHATSTAV